MPTRPPKTYQYQTGDDPTKLAQQFGTTPQALISANPGGYPFSVGQTINLPTASPFSGGTTIIGSSLPAGTPFNPVGSPLYNYAQQLRNQAPVVSNIQGVQTTYTNPYTPGSVNSSVVGQNRPPTPSNYNPAQRGRGYKPNPYEEAQAGLKTSLQNEIQNAMTSQAPPAILSPGAASSMGINPTQAGYIMQNGQWVYNAEYAATLETAQGTDTTGGGGGGEQDFNPKNISYTWNKYAKNPKSRFETNLKWAQNAWRRKKLQAKGIRKTGKQIIAERQAQVQQQTNDSITGFGLVDFSASAG